jgi:hypothetical protein
MVELGRAMEDAPTSLPNGSSDWARLPGRQFLTLRREGIAQIPPFARNCQRAWPTRLSMSGVDGIAGKRTSAWEEHYEKPLTKEAEKAAVTVANAAWIEKEGRPSPAPYSPEMFSNPAMRGPPVTLAAPPPPSPPKPAGLPAAADAFHGIELALTATTPRYQRTDTTASVSCGPYKLYPALKADAAGREAVVYWHAVNRGTKREDFVVGPDSLATFTSDPQKYAEIALRVFANGEPDKETIESMKVVDAAMKHGAGAALAQLGHAWHVAVTDPEWVVRRTTDLATAAAGGSHAPSRAARATEAASAEITAGRAPAGSVGAARRYNYEASPKHGTQKVGNVSAAPRGGQAALDSSVQVKETSPRRVGVDYDAGELVVFDETHPGDGVFHGHIRSWDELTDQQRNAFSGAGLTDKRGRIMRGEP